MDEYFSRSELLLGKNSTKKLKNTHIAVFGIGGVGSYAVEALVRMGIGNIDLIDKDYFSPSNINRQLYATVNTIGKAKVDAAKERIKEINPLCNVNAFQIEYSKETENQFDLSKYDYIIDAIDSVDSKIRLIENAKKMNVNIISSMGAGNKLDPTKFKVADIYATSVCPLARIMRGKLKEKGIEALKTVYSTEKPIKNDNDTTVGSVSFVPSVAGLILAGEVIKDLLK